MNEFLVCPMCGIFLFEPYIQCVDCKNPPRSFCIPCFSKCRDYENHSRHHFYSVVRNNIPVLHFDWLASEELKLLNAVADHGIGNWAEIAKDVKTKNKFECQEHYLNYYVYNLPTNSTLPVAEKFFQEDFPFDEGHHPTPVICHTLSSDPPRPIVGSTLYRDMAGYMPGRGDFHSEHDDFAELDIKSLVFEDSSENMDNALWNELQLTVLSIYQRRLMQRIRRKWIFKDYGIISQTRNLEDSKRYLSLGVTYMEQMKALMHLFTFDDFAKHLEGDLCEDKTKQRIELLQQCRAAGITKKHSIATFVKLKKKHEERKKVKTVLDEVLAQIKDEVSCHQYIRKQVLHSAEGGGPGRRPAPPLNIAAMPGFENLSSREKELCSSLRIMPTSYLQYKSTLVNEYRKVGSLRLANARSLIKIDVNKTRKIYDMLVEEGLVSKT